MAEKNITITISARDMSAGELDKARRALAGFSDEAKRSRGASDLAGGGFGNLSSMAQKLLPALSVAGLIGFGKSLLDGADALQRMADQTDMTAEQVQRLQYVGSQTGVSMESMVGAIQNLQQRLGSGDEGAVGALARLNINAERFQSLNPYQQFLELSDAIGGVTDPTERATLAAEVFGKTWKAILPAINKDARALAESATVMSNATVRSLDEAGDRLSAWGMKLKVWASEAVVAVGRVELAFKAWGDVTEHGLNRTSVGVGLYRAGLALVTGDSNALAKTTLPGVESGFKGVADRGLKPLALSLKDAAKIERDLTSAFKENTDAADAAEKKARAIAEQQKAQNTLWAARTAGLQTLAGVTKNAAAVDEAYADGLAAIGNAYNIVTDEMTWYGRATDEVAARTREANFELMGLRDTMKSLADGLPSARVGLDGLFEKLTKSDDAVKATTGTWAGMGEAASAVLNGINNQVAQTASLMINTLSGAIKSFSKGDVWGGIAAIGAGVVGLLGQAWGKISKAEGRKVNDLRDAYFAAAGGFEALHAKLIAANATGAWDTLWNAKTVKEWDAGVAAAEKAIASYNDELERTKGIQSEIDALQKTLTDRSVMNWEKAESLATKYGGSLASLGQQFESAKLHAGFADLWNDWESMRNMGGDVGGMLSMMKEEIGHLVAESARLGTEIPEQFKPFVQQLIDSKQLFDDNGEAITDMGALKFGAPLVSEVDKIVAAIDKLIQQLTQTLIPTIGDIPREVEIGVGYKYDSIRDPGGSGGEGDTYQYAAGGLVTSPRRAWIGEGGQPEIVGPVDFMARALAGAMSRVGGMVGGGGASPQIIVQPRIYLDGRELTKGIAPWLPGEVAAYGVG